MLAPHHAERDMKPAAEAISPLSELRLAGLREAAVRLGGALWFAFIAFGLLHAIAETVRGTSLGDLTLVMAAQLVSRSCTFLFFMTVAWVTLVRSRPVAQAPGLGPRVAAFLGTYLPFTMPLLPHGGGLPASLHFVSAFLILCGNGLALAIIFRLGRSFSLMAEARRLVSDGIYGVIRHPLYAAEQIAVIGVFLQFLSPAAALVYAAQLACQYLRIRNEERVLAAAFPDYSAYMARTARLVPGLW
jgi:protein-S-isoprenylcysteine O-methyltransferase Ste14